MPDLAVPVLYSLVLLETRKFFRYFGFELVSPAEGALVAGEDVREVRLRRGDVELLFEPTDIDFTGDMVRFSRCCFIYVDDLDAWRRAFADTRMNWKTFYPRLSQVREADERDFFVVDRDANLLRLVQTPRS